MSSTAGLPVQTAPNALFAACSRAGDVAEDTLAAEASQLPLWIPVAFGIGIAAYLVIPWNYQRLGAVAVMAIFVALAPVLRGAVARVAGWAGVLMLLGFGVAWARTTMVAAPRLERPAIVQLVGTVAAVELRTASGQVRLRIAPFDPALPRAVRVSVPDSTSAAVAQLRPGARVSVTARLAPPSGPVMPGGYDFARHAWFEQLGASGSALGNVSILAPAPTPTRFAARLATMRAELTARLKAKVPGVSGSFAAAFVTGDQGAIPKPVAQAMRDSGLAHLLSISGLHIAIVAAGTLWTLRKLLLLWPWLALRIPVRAIAASFAAVAAIAYTLLAGSDIPTVRACLATIIVLLGVIVGREALTLRMVAAAAFVILLFRPEALLSPSFQLSFAAVTGLVALYQSRFGAWLNTRQPYDGWFVRLARTALALVVTGLVAEAMLSATALYHFNRTGIYGVIANLVAIPLTSFVIMPLQVLALALDAVGLGAPVYWLLGQAYGWLIAWALEVAAWPGGVLRMPSMSVTAYMLLVGGGLWLCLWQGRVRLWAAVPVALGVMLAVIAQPPDLLVSADGRQVGIRINGNGLARVRSREASYAATNWQTASAADTSIKLSNYRDARCSRFGCIVRVGAGTRAALVLVTTGDELPPGYELGTACNNVDIVISDLTLPSWCQPRRMRIDRATLAQTQAMAIWLSAARTATVAAQIGDHPWLPAKR